MIAHVPPAALVAPAPAPHFAPPLGRPLRLRTTQERQIGPVTLRFVAERRLVFRAEQGGFVAELTLEHLEATPAGKTAERFRTSQAGLLGRTLRFHLDNAGQILSLDDLVGHWEAQAARLDGGGANPLRSIPADRRLPLLASLLSQAIVDEAPPPAGTRAVIVPLAGAPAPMRGTEVVTLASGGDWSVAVSAGGQTASGEASLSRRRSFSGPTGLLRTSEEITRVTARMPRGDAIETITTTLTTLMVS